MSKKENPKYDVTILNRWEETRTFPDLTRVMVKGITYVGAGLWPSTIWIPLDEYTPEKEDEAIREDIEKRLNAKPEKKTV